MNIDFTPLIYGGIAIGVLLCAAIWALGLFLSWLDFGWQGYAGICLGMLFATGLFRLARSLHD